METKMDRDRGMWVFHKPKRREKLGHLNLNALGKKYELHEKLVQAGSGC